MIRLGFYIILAVFFALGAVWLADNPGEMLIHWRGWEIRMSMAIFFLIFLIYSLALWGLLRLFRWFRTGNPLTRESRRESRREKGMVKLNLGWSALAVEDKAAAARYAKAARKLLPDDFGPLRLLAQALPDEPESPGRLYDNPDTRLLALKGQMVRADEKRTHDILQEMQALSPKNPWITARIFDNLTRLGRWREAREILGKMKQDKSARNHLSATLNHCQGLEADISGHKKTAMDFARAALKDNAAFMPAALFLARALHGQGDKLKAAKVIETIWKIAPHPDLAKLYLDLEPHLDEAAREARRDKLKKINPDTGETARWLCGNCGHPQDKYAPLCPNCDEFGRISVYLA